MKLPGWLEPKLSILVNVQPLRVIVGNCPCRYSIKAPLTTAARGGYPPNSDDATEYFSDAFCVAGGAFGRPWLQLILGNYNYASETGTPDDGTVHLLPDGHPLSESELRSYFRRLWTKVHRIKLACAGVSVVCKRRFPIDDVLLRSGEIRDQVKLVKLTWFKRTRANCLDVRTVRYNEKLLYKKLVL